MEHVQIIGCCFDMLECRTICCECFSMASTCIVVCPINDTNGGGVSWNNQAPHRKPWSSRSQNFPISCIQESTYYKIHVIPTLGYYNFIIWAAGVQASIRGTATWGPDKGDGLPKGCRQQHLRVSACLLSFICGIWKSCRHDLPSLKSKYQVNYRGEWLLDSTSYLIVPRPHWKIYPTVGYPSSARDMAPTPIWCHVLLFRRRAAFLNFLEKQEHKFPNSLLTCDFNMQQLAKALKLTKIKYTNQWKT